MRLKDRNPGNRPASRTIFFALAKGSRPLRIAFLAAFTAFSLSAPFARAQSASAAAAPASSLSASLLAVPPRNWVVDTTVKQLEVIHNQSSYLRYRMHLVNAKGDYVREIVESKDGSVARLILRDGKPLTEEQDKAERQRLNDMLKDPAGFAKHVKDNESGRKIADQLLRLMPDAMIYTYAPGQPQTGKHPGMTEIVLDYEPNPKFHPPTTTAEALTGLKGRAWIDSKTKQTIRLEGNIFRSVNFGWGMLAHIYPGGHLVLDQVDAGNGRWIFTHFTERISVRALMVKTLNIQSDIDAWGYQPVPRMSYQEAVRLLLDTPLPAR
ncbi:MAG TPA: hypothetical protein VK596_06625 [Edaphobacter sp.]|nr:hypothetical protein [Edaphobacter sp.]